MVFITINDKKYNEGFLKRLICKVCEHHNYPDLDYDFFKVKFTEKIDNLHDIPEYEGLKSGSYNSEYLCQRCISELFFETPETIQNIERIFSY